MRISHDDGPVVLAGSCFSDNIGERLQADGFAVCHNPMGPLYNPVSMATAITRLLEGHTFTAADLTAAGSADSPADVSWHALDFPLRYSDNNPDRLLQRINREFARWSQALTQARTTIFTFGTAWTFYYRPTGRAVGNCHKFAASDFDRRCLTIDEIAQLWQPLCTRLHELGKQVIITVSPIRHLADGLHGNQLSKATLLMACDRLDAQYFPAYEIMVDDLRDYRFYADDLKHPSPMAVEYIYNKFTDTFFTEATRAESQQRHARWLREQHRKS